MALKTNSLTLDVVNAQHLEPTRHGALLEGGVPPYNVDVEGGDERKLSRIESDTDSTLTVGKQIELEANNAIKYRTCSWPKVNYSFLRQNKSAGCPRS